MINPVLESKDKYFITYVHAHVCVSVCTHTCDCACVHILAVLDIQDMLDTYSTPGLQSQPLMNPAKAAFTVKNLCSLFTVGHMGC